MLFQYLSHQSIDGSTDCGYLMQDFGTPLLGAAEILPA